MVRLTRTRASSKGVVVVQRRSPSKVRPSPAGETVVQHEVSVETKTSIWPKVAKAGSPPPPLRMAPVSSKAPQPPVESQMSQTGPAAVGIDVTAPAGAAASRAKVSAAIHKRI